VSAVLLLVEDNPADVDLVLEGLADGAGAPVAVETAASGATAIRRLQDQGLVMPDLVLLDLNLPARGGHEVLTEIRADPRLRTLPVVVFTSSGSAEDIRTSYDLGANCYVTKPPGLTRYFEVVRGIEEFWLRTARLPGGADRNVPATTGPPRADPGPGGDDG
jgi:chemotaxis family two-component system response regulator Rcp1